MDTITFRDLQRLTVKELEDKVPCVITSNGWPKFVLEGSDSQEVKEPVKKKESTVKATASSRRSLCKHGQMFCKFNCR